MFWKWLATGSALLLGFVGASMLDCTYSFLGFVDAFDICFELDFALPGGSIVVGSVLVGVGAVLLGFAWVPYFLDLNREMEGLEETGEALLKNVHRLPEEASGPVEKLLVTHDEDVLEGQEPVEDGGSIDLRDPPTDNPPAESSVGSKPEGPTESLLRRTELMETLLREETVTPQTVAKHWIELLREADELHTRGTIDDVTFREVNSRLLDLYVSPDDDPSTARRKVGSELIF